MELHEHDHSSTACIYICAYVFKPEKYYTTSNTPPMEKAIHVLFEKTRNLLATINISQSKEGLLSSPSPTRYKVMSQNYSLSPSCRSVYKQAINRRQ